ncbi:MAG TPA: glycosyltransferase family 39 protein [Actinotalea caeni]|uniref:glycosyltransferase family 39 protein n=1 Tax=Actinotalea caeni TaxID=1348467 RepID=UPI002B4B1816|nr:glycosyltransferase family 39 protein [Actinotalea caeni]HLV57162.1 glycosyltransferase family 39 protein [Actinotalea caeni]
MAQALPPLARGRVLGAAGALALLLAGTAGGYGYHRDELYFRMLPPAWGHLDQPPLTPLLARSLAAVVDEPWALRLPAVVAACLTVVVVALVARELGGGAAAQGIAAWGAGFGVFPLAFGHVLLTASLDMLLWPVVVLCVVRAVRRSPAWWFAAGAVAGLALANKLLVLALLASLGVAILLVGPRHVLRSPWPWAGVLAVLVVGSPSLLYQALEGWPQLRMGQALGETNADEVRVLVLPFLALLLGPLLVPVWGAGLVALLRRPAWRELRFLPVALGLLVVLTVVMGTQPYYPLGLLLVLHGVGSVPVAEWAARGRVRRGLAIAAVALDGVVAAVVALPLVPLERLGGTPVPEVNQLAADQVGWERYAEQVRDVAVDAGADVVIASNYGEAGALDRYGSGGVPVVSGHNALAALTAPPPAADVVVVVGGQYGWTQRFFERCEVRDRLDNGLGVDNEEQGVPVAVCHDPLEPWDTLWPRLAHLD